MMGHPLCSKYRTSDYFILLQNYAAVTPENKHLCLSFQPD